MVTTLSPRRAFKHSSNRFAPNSHVFDRYFNYTGKHFGSDTGLQNNLNRWYEPATGKWLSVDPIGFDHNLYRYVTNNTPVLRDPSGYAATGDKSINSHPSSYDDFHKLLEQLFNEKVKKGEECVKLSFRDFLTLLKTKGVNLSEDQLFAMKFGCIGWAYIAEHPSGAGTLTPTTPSQKPVQNPQLPFLPEFPNEEYIGKYTIECYDKQRKDKAINRQCGADERRVIFVKEGMWSKNVIIGTDGKVENPASAIVGVGKDAGKFNYVTCFDSIWVSANGTALEDMDKSFMKICRSKARDALFDPANKPDQMWCSLCIKVVKPGPAIKNPFTSCEENSNIFFA